MIEPEKATKNIELVTDESFEKELGSQIQNEWEVKDKEKYNNMDNDLTRSNNMEIQNWVLQLDSTKKVHVSSKTSKEDLPKTSKNPTVKTQTKPYWQCSKTQNPSKHRLQMEESSLEDERNSYKSNKTPR